MVARTLAIRVAIYWTELHRAGPCQTDEGTDVACGNVTAPHQTDACHLTTDQMLQPVPGPVYETWRQQRGLDARVGDLFVTGEGPDVSGHKRLDAVAHAPRDLTQGHTRLSQVVAAACRKS